MKLILGALVTLCWGTGVIAQVGINTASPNPSSILDIRSSDRGILIPQINLKTNSDKTSISNGNIKSLLVFNTNTTMGEGYYYWDGSFWQKLLVKADANSNFTANNGITLEDQTVKLGGALTKKTVISTTTQNTLAFDGLTKNNVQADTDYIVGMSSTNEIKALKAAMPKFFYMPSIAIPTHTDQLNVNETLGTIDLYEKYKSQFQTPARKNSNTTTSLPTLAKNELDYYITWFDTDVFNTVTVNDNGILTYTIKPNADITMASFMNIIFAVKP